MPRPIEMHAHDPRRFISDMLAWVHQAGSLPTCSACLLDILLAIGHDLPAYMIVCSAMQDIIFPST